MKIITTLAAIALGAGLALPSAAYADIILAEAIASRNFNIVTSESDLIGSTPVFGSGTNTGFKKISPGPAMSYGLMLNTGFANWSSSATEAITQKTFVDTVVSFSETANYGLTSLSYGLRRGNNQTATLTFALFTKLNDGSFINSGLSFTLASNETKLTEKTFDLSGLTALDSIGQGDVLTLRLAIFSSDTNDTISNFSFGNLTNLGTGINPLSSALVLEGTTLDVSPIPEPGTAALMGGIMALGTVVYRRKSIQKSA